MMKRVLFVFVFLFAAMQWSFAQSDMKEVVYLKNGSIIKGIIVEQVPNKSLKIQTADGSLFVCDMKDVEKITKEAVYGSHNRSYSSRDLNTKYVKRGYKGFVDFGYTVGTGDFSEGRVELTTSHGFQFNPYLFLGGGTGFNYYHESEVFAMPLFVDFRANFMQGPIVPFAGVKTGYTASLSDDADDLGFYFAPSVGVKFMLNNRLAFNATLGYTVQLAEVYYYSYYNNYYSDENLGGVSIKVGLEF
ncbi:MULTISPECIES: hypothetical protein [Parabacteroides]|uniref:hypothetical protein n=1 Tax=Parabacteroides leei TaxID=2939491 RepID=UPI001E390F85|nr:MULTISPECIES: hypothetical protein [Parabacteroides]MCL3853042.1 hypothetical protein [Parabacteroides leei]